MVCMLLRHERGAHEYRNGSCAVLSLRDLVMSWFSMLAAHMVTITGGTG